MQFRRSLALLVVLACAAGELLADDTVQLPSGARVRVTIASGGDALTGKVLALDDKTLMLQITGKADSTLLRRGDITTVAVSSGRRSRWKGALIGAGVGAGAGMGIGLASGSDPKGSFFALTAGEKALIFGTLLAPIAALIGLAAPPAERWKMVQLDRIRLSVVPVRGRGLGVSFALAF